MNGGYSPLDFLILRVPWLPVQAYLGLDGEFGQALPPLDDHKRYAVAVASESLYNELERTGRSLKKTAAARSRLLRYLIRMSMRTAPFGRFASVALARWGRTDLALAPSPPLQKTRPDMGWLNALVRDLEGREDVRPFLRFQTNPAVTVGAGRAFLDEPELSIPAPEAVSCLLRLARRSIAYPALISAAATQARASAPQARTLVRRLWEQGFLMSDLRPPLGAAEPAQVLARRLESIPPAKDAADALRSILSEAASLDRDCSPQGVSRYRALERRALAQGFRHGERAFQVDTARALSGDGVSPLVGRAAARAAELLLSLSPAPRGSALLDDYRRRFVSRYGIHREIPLPELLSPLFGLGPLPPEPADAPSPRDEILLGLAADALREGRREAALDEKTLAALRRRAPEPERAPLSLDLFCSVCAVSAAEVDAGRFLLVVSPNAGVLGAGRSFGRFADLIGARAQACLLEIARREEALAPGRLRAEVTFWPREPHQANLVISPLARSHEIPLSGCPAALDGRVIALDELAVGLRDGRFFLRWTTTGQEIVPCAGHVFNPDMGPPVYRFLSQLSADGLPELRPFDWGAARALPFLPRLSVGNIVLSRARWRLDPLRVRLDFETASAEGFARALSRWRKAWNVPPHVFLAQNNDRLTLDLESRDQAELLREELLRAGDGAVILEEALPGPADAWVKAGEDAFVSEFAVPLMLSKPASREAALPAPPSVGAPSERLKAPGGDWLYLKLYGPWPAQDRLLAGPLSGLVERALDSGWAEGWFFIRYGDPESHLRLRFRGDPERLARELAPAAYRLCRELMADGSCLRFAVDTYEREIERYGGPESLALLERAFQADSRAVAGLLGLLEREAPPIDRLCLAAFTLDDLLDAFGFTRPARALWCRARGLDRRVGAGDYRKNHIFLRAPAVGDLARLLDERRLALGPVARALREGSTRCAKPLPEIVGSLAHMHCNRLGIDPGEEESRVLGMVLRANLGPDRP